MEMMQAGWLEAALGLLAGLLIGVLLAWLMIRGKRDAQAKIQAAMQDELATLRERARMLEQERGQRQAELEQLRGQAGAMRDELDLARDQRAQWQERAQRLPQLEQALSQEQARLEQVRSERAALEKALAELQARSEVESAAAQEKLAMLQNAREQLSDQFKSLANDILEEKSKRFVEQNHHNLGQLLNPLNEKIKEFQSKVEDVYVKENKDRSALGEQVRQLMDLNRKLSDDAHNLTQALKGSSKTQGSWGELILEKVLEGSGLRRGEEYELQESHTLEDGSRMQPDVVIRLPEQRHLVVDAKVSLLAYDEFSSSEEGGGREAALKRHLDSVRTHIKGLSAKNYHDLYRLKSLDFVLMFVPIEPAFALAIGNDRELFMDAWKKNVLLVSPSTLLFVVRTVAHLWRQEQQSRNAQEIAQRGAELYDKLVGFVTDLDRLGERLDQAKSSYDAAYGKFASGRGNLIRQAEMLKELGVKPNKPLPTKLLEAAFDEPLDAPALQPPPSLGNGV